MSENNTSPLQEKRDYNQHSYTTQQISDAITLFMSTGGSIKTTKDCLIQRWGFSPSEPTLRKWLTASNEAMNLLDQRTAHNLQNDVAEIMGLAMERLKAALENDEIPPAKLGTITGIMIDKWLLLNKIRNDLEKNSSNDIIGENLLSDKDEIVNALIESKIELD